MDNWWIFPQELSEHGYVARPDALERADDPCLCLIWVMARNKVVEVSVANGPFSL